MKGRIYGEAMLTLRVSLITLFYYYDELANGPGSLTKKKETRRSSQRLSTKQNKRHRQYNEIIRSRLPVATKRPPLLVVASRLLLLPSWGQPVVDSTKAPTIFQ